MGDELDRHCFRSLHESDAYGTHRANYDALAVRTEERPPIAAHDATCNWMSVSIDQNHFCAGCHLVQLPFDH